MPRALRHVDALVVPVQSFFVASIVEQEDVSAAGPTPELALERLTALLASLTADGIRVEPHEHPARKRALELELPAEVAGRLHPLKLRALAIYYQPEPDDLLQVHVPQLGLHFDAREPGQIKRMCEELLREDVPLQLRASSLAHLTGERGLGELAQVQVAPWAPPVARFVPKDPETLSAVGTRVAPSKSGRSRGPLAALMLDYLSEMRERGVLLVGPAGAGKSAVVAEAARRLDASEGSDVLEGYTIWQISGGRIMAGMRFLGQWQERVLSIIEEARERAVILYVDDLVELIEASGNERDTQGIAGMLLPHVVSGDIAMIAELRPEQVAVVAQRQPALVRALRRVDVEPMSRGEVDALLTRLSQQSAREGGATLSPGARERVLELSARFMGRRAWPGPAVELAERALTTTREPVEVDADAIVRAMRAQSGMPVELIDPHAPFDADEVRAFFSSRILGQPDAVDAMVELVTVLRAGLNAPGRPMGSLLFLGPTGVGKTQTALTLARYLFGDEDRLVRLDMSEYQDAWSAARLVGRWGGEPGDLVQKLSEQPFRVVLLDEIEKGHPSVFDMLLQVLGEGRLTGANGQTVQATHAVFVMTSNLGAAGPASLGFGAAEDASRSRLHFLRAVEAFFRPEFVGRIERLIPFGALGPDTARKLVERTLDESFAREGVTRRGVRVRATGAVVDRLIEVGFDTRYGARPLKQAVERLVTSTLAAFLASEPDADELSLVVDLDADGHVYVDIGDD